MKEHQEYIQLLKSLISTPSFSKLEDQTASLLFDFLKEKNIEANRFKNNIWARSKHWDDTKPTVLLNSHHDTVKPVSTWTRDPFNPTIEGDLLYGLGSNDAGGSLISLLATFIHFYNKPKLGFNLLLSGTAEEEISGANGIAALLPKLGKIDVGIVGEPTQMRMAIAEKGLMVVDGQAIGQSGHAARAEGINALYIAISDIEKLKSINFDKVSDLLGPTKLTVTQINAGTQHNVVPDKCTFVIDVRTNEKYSNQEVFDILQSSTESTLSARSFRLNSSGINLDHPLIKTGIKMNIPYYGSPTLSDQALMNFPTLKMGPGKSKRSHTANEYIKISEINNAIHQYTTLINNLNQISFKKENK